MSATRSLLILPASTICTISIVSSSVTRSPLTNRGSLPTRCIHREISGPPPCTSTGLTPTYLSKMTSRMTDFFSSGSVIALPPYLMTNVLPKNVRMYGSASIKTPAFSMSLASPGGPPPGRLPRFSPGGWLSTGTPSLGPVPGIDPHVVLRQVARPHHGRGRPRLQRHRQDHLRPLQRRRSPRLVERHARPVACHQHVADPDVHPRRIEVDAGAAGGGQDAAPVGVVAVHGRLHQVGAGDGASHLQRVDFAGGAFHPHFDELRGPFAVPCDGTGQVRVDVVQR